MNTKSSFDLHFAVICLIPLLTIAASLATAPHDNMQHLINGITLACEAAFLFKYVLFKVVKHHLKQEIQAKQQTLWLFLPIAILIVYLFHYFGAF